MSSTVGAAEISLVIPAYNEAVLLPRLLASVAEARARFRGGADSVEVIVADNDSTDGTADVARAHGCRVAHTPVRRIAAARNAGAAAAHGRLLAFVDADSQLHPETFNAIADQLAREDVVGGSTGVRMERWSPGIAVAYAMIVPVVWATGMDTGVVFCRRADFEALGGYDETLRFAEDVQFLVALRRLGRAGGRRLVRATAAKAIASARKFDQFGDWHYAAMLIRVPWLLLSRGARQRFADRYWYELDR